MRISILACPTSTPGGLPIHRYYPHPNWPPDRLQPPDDVHQSRAAPSPQRSVSIPELLLVYVPGPYRRLGVPPPPAAIPGSSLSCLSANPYFTHCVAPKFLLREPVTGRSLACVPHLHGVSPPTVRRYAFSWWLRSLSTAGHGGLECHPRPSFPFRALPLALTGFISTPHAVLRARDDRCPPYFVRWRCQTKRPRGSMGASTPFCGASGKNTAKACHPSGPYLSYVRLGFCM